MKLTPKEREICNKYSKRDENGYVHCDECPLNLDGKLEDIHMGDCECYATIDGRRARKLKRYR